MLNDFRLMVFESVARLGSFSAAARELGVSQPAVSQNVAELERQLEGVQLFERSAGSVTLTAKGENFLQYVRQIIHWYEAAYEAVAEDAPAPTEVRIDSDSVARIWTSQGDIHIKIIKDE